MIISVASGKGGTGKTTIATNLALALETEVQILDCDVEEPNVHLFLQPQINTVEMAETFVPEVDEAACTLCRKCVDICRFKALTVIGKMLLTFPELCHSCGGCLVVCPENAICEGKRELGQIELGAVNTEVNFGHGRMRVGEAMAPPLIRDVRAHSSANAITIIDAPPGTSCPVIAAMKDTNFVLLVTEPTPFGLHDLKLAVEAVRCLGIPSGLVINRADMGNDEVEAYAAEKGLPVLMKIPFDRQIARLYSEGIPFVQERSEWRERFRQLYRDIETLSQRGIKG